MPEQMYVLRVVNGRHMIIPPADTEHTPKDAPMPRSRLLVLPPSSEHIPDTPLRGVFAIGEARDGSVLIGSRDRHGRWCRVEMVPADLEDGVREIMAIELRHLDPELRLIA